MIEIGKVTQLKNKGKYCKVEFERRTQCEKCGMCFANKKDMKVNLVVENTLNAKIGDAVTIELKSGAVFLSAFIVYGIPTMLTLLAVVIGVLCKLSELICFFIAMATLAASFVGVAFIDKYVRKKNKIVPVMIKIME